SDPRQPVAAPVRDRSGLRARPPRDNLPAAARHPDGHNRHGGADAQARLSATGSARRLAASPAAIIARTTTGAGVGMRSGEDMLRLVEECVGVGEVTVRERVFSGVRYEVRRFQAMTASGMPVPGLHRIE